jgi:hypothetical protein
MRGPEMSVGVPRRRSKTGATTEAKSRRTSQNLTISATGRTAPEWWECTRLLQHFGELGDILAATHGEVGLAAAFAADLGREVLDDLAGLVPGFDRAR